jgi:predicted dienelactone hydrolase
VVIFSHGLGGTRDGYGYIGKHLASHGYIVVHVQHAGSDRDSIADAITNDGKTVDQAMKQIAADPANILNRPRDISFAIDQMIEMNKKEGSLKGLIDGAKIGVDGHSFGAYTVMAVAGQTFGQGLSFRDERIKATIAMSPSPPRRADARFYDDIAIPTMLMTGTMDDSPIGGMKAADRLKVFDLMTHCTRYMVVFDGGDHMVFSGRARELDQVNIPGKNGDAAKDKEFQTFVKAATVAFFDAHLKGDEPAKKWLTADDGAKAALGQAGAWKWKEK